MLRRSKSLSELANPQGDLGALEQDIRKAKKNGLRENQKPHDYRNHNLTEVVLFLDAAAE